MKIYGFQLEEKDANKQLTEFLKQRFTNFWNLRRRNVRGKNFLFHSCLSLNMNIGLLTPRDVINKALQHAEQESIPINSLEGFIRQIIGWKNL